MDSQNLAIPSKCYSVWRPHRNNWRCLLTNWTLLTVLSNQVGLYNLLTQQTEPGVLHVPLTYPPKNEQTLSLRHDPISPLSAVQVDIDGNSGLWGEESGNPNPIKGTSPLPPCPNGLTMPPIFSPGKSRKRPAGWFLMGLVFSINFFYWITQKCYWKPNDLLDLKAGMEATPGIFAMAGMFSLYSSFDQRQQIFKCLIK